MKKTIFFCIMTMLVCFATTANAQQSKGIYIDMTGQIGTSNGWLNMNGTKGSYSYATPTGRIQRILTFGSYNKKSGRLVLNATDKRGNYIGQFDGTYTRQTYYEDGQQLGYERYKGTFTNNKGVKITFDLYMD